MSEALQRFRDSDEGVEPCPHVGTGFEGEPLAVKGECADCCWNAAVEAAARIADRCASHEGNECDCAKEIRRALASAEKETKE